MVDTVGPNLGLIADAAAGSHVEDEMRRLLRAIDFYLPGIRILGFTNDPGTGAGIAIGGTNGISTQDITLTDGMAFLASDFANAGTYPLKDGWVLNRAYVYRTRVTRGPKNIPVAPFWEEYILPTYTPIFVTGDAYPVRLQIIGDGSFQAYPFYDDTINSRGVDIPNVRSIFNTVNYARIGSMSFGSTNSSGGSWGAISDVDSLTFLNNGVIDGVGTVNMEDGAFTGVNTINGVLVSQIVGNNGPTPGKTANNPYLLVNDAVSDVEFFLGADEYTQFPIHLGINKAYINITLDAGFTAFPFDVYGVDSFTAGLSINVRLWANSANRDVQTDVFVLDTENDNLIITVSEYPPSGAKLVLAAIQGKNRRFLSLENTDSITWYITLEVEVVRSK